jgi:hypothetical protein
VSNLIRPFELRDFSTLHRYRRRGVFLDCIPTLTWGETLVPLGAMSLPLSAAMGVFTSVYEDTRGDSETMIAQVSHSAGSHFARLTFLAPDSAIVSPDFPALLEDLVHRVGERGAQNLIAQVDEKTETFEALRREHFSIYARQHIWRMMKMDRKSGGQFRWRSLTSGDGFHVRKLYHAIVPTMVQQVEPSPWDRGEGWVFYQDGEMMACVEVFSGLKGIWVQPFIHPEFEGVDQQLVDLLRYFGPRKTRPVYVCLRSYQAWLSHALEAVGAEVSSSQAVMVRRLAVSVKKPALAPIPQINDGKEPTTSYIKETLQEDNGVP